MGKEIPVLVALTGEARRALSGAAEVVVARFPFRVGRDTGSPVHTDVYIRGKDGRVVPQTENDLYIWDPGPLLNVSRQHFQIERQENGEFFVRDMGSTCGTLVGNLRLGLGGPESCAIVPDSTIVVGTAQSPFVFRFELREATARDRGHLRSAESNVQSLRIPGSSFGRNR